MWRGKKGTDRRREGTGDAKMWRGKKGTDRRREGKGLIGGRRGVGREHRVGVRGGGIGRFIGGR